METLGEGCECDACGRTGPMRVVGVGVSIVCDDESGEMETCFKDISYPGSLVFCACKKCWDERNRHAAEVHEVATQRMRAHVKEYWIGFNSKDKAWARRLYRAGWEKGT